MKIRRIKKGIKKVGSPRDIRAVLKELKLIKVWSKLGHKNSSTNMKIITGNFYRNGSLI
jgi:ribosomal protein L30/L7E